MVFELILTNFCTRSCNFCNICHSNFKVTDKQVDIFSKAVRDSVYKNKTVNFFGGEPLIEIDKIERCIKSLEGLDIKYNLVTNGDLIERLYTANYKDKLRIQVSAYDIFENVQKYIEMKEKFRNFSLTYTFTQDDIDKIEKYKNICETIIRCDYSYVFSHSKKSWDRIDCYELQKRISEITKMEIEESILKGQITSPIENKFKRLIEFGLKGGKLDNINCLFGERKVFYHGKFLDIPCILFAEKQEINKTTGCCGCKYELVCSKSCNNEVIDGKVPYKLCIIEKTQFDILSQFFNCKYHC